MTLSCSLRYHIVVHSYMSSCCCSLNCDIMLLFTQICPHVVVHSDTSSCCCSLRYVVTLFVHSDKLSCCYSLRYVVMLLFIQIWHNVGIHSYVISHWSHHVVVHSIMLLFTQSCYSLVMLLCLCQCYSLSYAVVRRGKDTNKNRAEWEHEREVMKREIERLKHELLRLVCLAQ